MTLTRATGAAILTPAMIDEALILPTLAASVAATVSHVVTIGASSLRVPVIADAPSAAWVAEGEEIPVSEAKLAELDIVPGKVAGLSIISNELADDSSPEAAAVVGAGLARDIAVKIDAAFFGAMSAPAPAGLGSLAGVTTVSAGSAITSADPFIEAVAAAENVGAAVTSFVANPADVLKVAKLKQATGSNVPLLQPDTTQPGRRIILGVPLLTSPAVTAGTIWGIPEARSYFVVRQDASVEADTAPFFTSDRTAIRAKMRVGFGWPQPAAVVKITVGA